MRKVRNKKTLTGKAAEKGQLWRATRRSEDSDREWIEVARNSVH
jgi:hypothetical protein